MGTQRHVILRQTVELSIVRGDDAWLLQQEASRILRKAQPLIERCCDEASAPGRLHRIERLELDLGELDSSRLEDDLLAKFGEALRLGLAGQIQRQESAGLSAKTAAQSELFAQFVRQGSLPWWADLSDPDQPQASLDGLLRDAPGLLRRLLPDLAQDPRALRRLAGHFDDRRLAALADLAAPALAGFPLSLSEALLSLPGHLPALAAPPPARFRNHLWQSLLGNAASPAQPPMDRLDFSRGVLMRLARLRAVPYPVLAQGFARAAAEGRFQGPVGAVAAALGAECAPEPGQAEPQSQGEALREAPPAPFEDGEADAAAWEELRLWLETVGYATRAASAAIPEGTQSVPYVEGGAREPAPPWPQSWPPVLREALLAQLQGTGKWLEAVGYAARTAAVAIPEGTQSVPYTEGGAREPAAPWPRSWPPVLREALLARFQGMGGPPEAAGHAAHTASAAIPDGTHRVPYADSFNDGLVAQQQWEQAQALAGFSDADEIFIGNAGLVILWPFLGVLFGRLGLLEENRFADDPARQRGVALLQYLASADTAAPEYLLPLNKLLCGMALESVFELETPLAEEETAECEALLEAVIAQAPVLNAMSIPGFRGSFLLRAGVLGIRDGAWLLRVEREAYDLVLDRFPWGFQWVKLPWMEAPLQVEW